MTAIDKESLRSYSGVLTRSLLGDSRRWFDEMSAEADEFNRFNGLLRSSGWTWHPDPLHQWSRRMEYPFVLANLPQAPALVLDAGGGVTFFTHFLARRGYRVALSDIDPRVQPITTHLCRELATEVAIEVAALERTPWPDGSFDAACCISVLEHVEDPRTCVRELARILRPGGRLLLTFDYEYRRQRGRVRGETIVEEVRKLFAVDPPPLLDVPADALTMRWHLAHQPERLWFEPNLVNRMRCYLGRIPDLVVVALNGTRK